MFSFRRNDCGGASACVFWGGAFDFWARAVGLASDFWDRLNMARCTRKTSNSPPFASSGSQPTLAMRLRVFLFCGVCVRGSAVGVLRWFCFAGAFRFVVCVPVAFAFVSLLLLYVFRWCFVLLSFRNCAAGSLLCALRCLVVAAERKSHADAVRVHASVQCHFPCLRW